MQKHTYSIKFTVKAECEILSTNSSPETFDSRDLPLVTKQWTQLVEMRQLNGTCCRQCVKHQIQRFSGCHQLELRPEAANKHKKH